MESLSLCISNLEWKPSTLHGSDVLEAETPLGSDPFVMSERLRENDPNSSYPVECRNGLWFIVCFPESPPKPEPTQSSEPRVWRADFTATMSYHPRTVATFRIYGPTVQYIRDGFERLRAIFRRAFDCIAVAISGIEPVDFDGEADGGWMDDTSNDVAMIDALAPLIRHTRSIAPGIFPDTETLARQLNSVFQTQPESKTDEPPKPISFTEAIERARTAWGSGNWWDHKRGTWGAILYGQKRPKTD